MELDDSIVTDADHDDFGLPTSSVFKSAAGLRSMKRPFGSTSRRGPKASSPTPSSSTIISYTPPVPRSASPDYFTPPEIPAREFTVPPPLIETNIEEQTAFRGSVEDSLLQNDQVANDHLTFQLNEQTFHQTRAQAKDPSSVVEKILSSYVPTQDNMNVFEKLDVLVCGKCQSVFHFVDEFKSHSNTCHQDETSQDHIDSSVHAVAMVLWCNTIRRRLHDGGIVIPEDENFGRKIQQKWFRLSQKARSCWMKAAKQLKELGQTGKVVFGGREHYDHLIKECRIHHQLLPKIKQEVQDEWHDIGDHIAYQSTKPTCLPIIPNSSNNRIITIKKSSVAVQTKDCLEANQESMDRSQIHPPSDSEFILSEDPKKRRISQRRALDKLKVWTRHESEENNSISKSLDEEYSACKDKSASERRRKLIQLGGNNGARTLFEAAENVEKICGVKIKRTLPVSKSRSERNVEKCSSDSLSSSDKKKVQLEISELSKIVPKGYEIVKHLNEKGRTVYQVRKKFPPEAGLAEATTQKRSTIKTKPQSRVRLMYKSNLVEGVNRTAKHSTPDYFLDPMSGILTNKDGSACEIESVQRPVEQISVRLGDTFETSTSSYVTLDSNATVSTLNYQTTQPQSQLATSLPTKEFPAFTHENIEADPSVVLQSGEVLPVNQRVTTSQSGANKVLLMLPGEQMYLLTDLTEDQCQHLNIKVHNAPTSSKSSQSNTMESVVKV